MKRIFVVVPLILAMAGCSGQSGSAAVSAPPDIAFSAEADVTYGGEDCKVQIRRLEADNWEFCVTEPYAVQGLIITVANGETRLKMYDMESIADINADAVSMARALAASYDSAAAGGAQSGGQNSKTLSGSSEFGTYTITFDDNGDPLSIGASAGKLSAELTKFAYLERDLSEPEIIE